MATSPTKDKRGGNLLLFLSKKKKSSTDKIKLSDSSSNLSDEYAECESDSNQFGSCNDKSPKYKIKRNRTTSALETPTNGRRGRVKKKKRKNSNSVTHKQEILDLDDPEIIMEKPKKLKNKKDIFHNITSLSGTIIRTPERRRYRNTNSPVKPKKLKRSVTDSSEIPAKSPRSPLGRRISVGIFKTSKSPSDPSPRISEKEESSDTKKNTVSAEDIKAILNEGNSESQGATEEEIKAAEEVLEKLEHPRVLSKQDLVNYFSSDENSSSGSQSGKNENSSYVPHSVLDAVLLLEKKRKKEKSRFMEEARVDALHIVPNLDENMFNDLHLPGEEEIKHELPEDEEEEEEAWLGIDLSGSDGFEVSEPSSEESVNEKNPKRNQSFSSSKKGNELLSDSDEFFISTEDSQLSLSGNIEEQIASFYENSPNMNHFDDSMNSISNGQMNYFPIMSNIIQNELTNDEMEEIDEIGSHAEEILPSSIVEYSSFPKSKNKPLNARVPSLSAMESSLDMEFEGQALWERKKSAQASQLRLDLTNSGDSKKDNSDKIIIENENQNDDNEFNEFELVETILIKETDLVDLIEIEDNEDVNNLPKLQEEFEEHFEDDEKEIISQKSIYNSPMKQKAANIIVEQATNSKKSKFRFGGAIEYCSNCGKVVYQMERIVALDRIWHTSCYRCEKCDRVIPPHIQYEIDKKPYCKNHYNMYIR